MAAAEEAGADVDTGGTVNGGFTNVLGLTGTGRAIIGSALKSLVILLCSLSRASGGGVCGDV